MIRILTDSTADFSMADAAALGVTVVPLTVSFGDTHYQNGVDLPLERFYDMLAAADKLPTTSQPSPERFLSHFLAAKQAGDTLICVLLSGALSGTCQSAQIARDEADYENIHIVDSRNATLGLQLLVRRAIQRVAEGFCAEDIVADLKTARTHLRLYAVVDTLKYLHKGGRLPGAAAIAGSLLGIKPVLSLDAHGKLGVADKARGMPGAYVAIFKGIGRCGGIDESWPVVVGYTGSPKGVGPFACYVTQNLHLQKPLVQPIGTVIGTHGGPGACGIAFFANEPFPEAAE